MSKAKLKKEIITFTREELVEVILAAYDSSKEAKDYFEFFLNPDAEAFLEKKIDVIAKEIGRTRRGHISKFRISFIRSTIKGAEAYGISPDDVMKLMYATLKMLAEQFRYVYYTETQLNGISKFAADYITYADDHDALSRAVDDIDALTRSNLGNQSIRKFIGDAAAARVSSLGFKKP